jgi:hypothetical protein
MSYSAEESLVTYNGVRGASRKVSNFDLDTSLMCCFRKYLSSVVGDTNIAPLQRTLFMADAAVQTDNQAVETEAPEQDTYATMQSGDTRVNEDDDISSLSSSDLANVLQWSQSISRDINLQSGKQA